MSDQEVALSFDTKIDPPEVHVAESEASLTVHVSIDVAQQGPRRVPLVLAVVLVSRHQDSGLSAIVGQALNGLIERLGDEDVIIGGEGLRLTADSIAEEKAWFSPLANLAQGLEAGQRILHSYAGVPTARRVLMVVDGPTSEQSETLTRVATELSEARIGVEILTTSGDADLGLLSRLANLGGGVICTTPPEEISAHFEQRLSILQSQQVRSPRLELTFPHGVHPGEMFRVSPVPSYLGAIRVGQSERTLVLDPGPIGLTGAPRFLLTVTGPRRVPGTYRICHLKLHWLEQGLEKSMESDVVLPTRPRDNHGARVDAALNACRGRIELLSWVEEMGRAQADGEHRRVSVLLERLTRRLHELDDVERAEQIGARRRVYLRSGAMSLVDLNTIRNVVIGLNLERV